MRAQTVICIAALGALLGACKSSTTESCNYNGGTQLAATTWPKFRADGANTGRAEVNLFSSRGIPAVLLQGFCGNGSNANINQPCRQQSDCIATPTSGPSLTPTGQTSPTTQSPSPVPTATPVGCMAVGSVVASPVLSDTFVYLASNDGTVYGLGPQDSLTRFGLSGPIPGTPLVGANGNLFVPGTGTLIQFFPDGTVNHQTALSGTVPGSPNIWSTNGTAYIGSAGGEFAGICPNGIPRYAVGFPSTVSSPAVVQDPHLAPGDLRPIAVGGGANGQVRAYDIKGRQYYAFTATNNIIASVMVDDSADPRVFYVADTNGQLFKVNLTSGQSVVQPTAPFFRAAYCSVTRNKTCVGDATCPASEHCIRASIIASPALSTDDYNTMYVADNTGVLWALNRATGQVIWNYPDTPPPPRRSITSSPAVATQDGMPDVIVFAVDFFDDHAMRIRSRMIALIDNGAAGPTPLGLWHSEDGLEGVPVCGTVGTSANALASSPSLAAPSPDEPATVYIGLSTVGDPDAPECQDVVPSNGGGLAAIMP